VEEKDGDMVFFGYRDNKEAGFFWFSRNYVKWLSNGSFEFDPETLQGLDGPLYRDMDMEIYNWKKLDGPVRKPAWFNKYTNQAV